MKNYQKKIRLNISEHYTRELNFKNGIFHYKGEKIGKIDTSIENLRKNIFKKDLKHFIAADDETREYLTRNDSIFF
jgi:hypothetical protein